MAAIIRVTAALAMGLGLSSLAQATPLVNTLLASGDTGDTARTLSSIGSAAQSFIADSSKIGNIELELARTRNTAGSIVITIYSDSGSNSLGSPLSGDTFTVSENAIPTTETLFDLYNITLTTSLTPGHKYWIDVAKSGTVSSEAFATTRSNTGSSATAYYHGSGSPVTASSMAICISDDNECHATNIADALYTFNEASQQTQAQLPAPEPASVALIGVGLIGIGAIRRRLARQRPVG